MTVKNFVDLSVVIVAYKSREFILRCIRSIHEAAQGLSLEIIIVDNASEDGVSDLVRAEFPDAIMIENKKNEGFARGVNQGASMAAGHYLCILNPDTQLYPETLKILLDFLEKYPMDCIVGPHTVDGSGKSNPSCRSLPHIVNLIKYPIWFLFQRKKLRKPHRYLLDLWEQNETIDVTKYNGYITGASILTRLDFFKEMGMFDEQYFLSSEDCDFGLRITRSGFHAFLVTEASLVHFEGRSVSKNPRSRLYAIDAYVRYIRKNFTFLHGVAYKTCFFLLVLSWAMGRFLRLKGSEVPILLQTLMRFIPYWLGGPPRLPEQS
jgi:N-acetylglucosaminyl-diphospho-decaprenol L-rhamnosyltransferase